MLKAKLKVTLSGSFGDLQLVQCETYEEINTLLRENEMDNHLKEELRTNFSNMYEDTDGSRPSIKSWQIAS